MRFLYLCLILSLMAAGMFGCSGAYDRDFPDTYSWIMVDETMLCLNHADVELDEDEDTFVFGYGNGGQHDWQESDLKTFVDDEWVCYDFAGEGLRRVTYAYEDPDPDVDEDWAGIRRWCEDPDTRHPFCVQDTDDYWSLGFYAGNYELSEIDEDQLADTM